MGTGERVMRWSVCAIVSTGWLFNLVAPSFSDYQSNLVANGPMLLVIAAVFPRKGEGKA